MKPTKTVPILLTIFLIALLAAGCVNKGTSQTVNRALARSTGSDYRAPKLSDIVNSETIKCKYYNDLDFKKSISHLPERQVGSLKIKGGIVPHHLLAGRMIADFFNVLSSQNPEIIVVIAPNHKGLGKKEVSIADWNWETPFGILQAEKTLIDSLVNSQLAAVDNRLMEAEHSISGLVPYIRYYLPNTKILPILVRGHYGLQESAELGQRIQNLVKNKNSVIVSSIDFSHYLNVSQADIKDRSALRAIETRDLQAISLMDNDNLDSPSAAIALLTSMNQAGAANRIILGHDNSARIARTNPNNTTSYYSIVFYK